MDLLCPADAHKTEDAKRCLEMDQRTGWPKPNDGGPAMEELEEMNFSIGWRTCQLKQEARLSYSGPYVPVD